VAMGLHVQATRVSTRQGLHGDGVITEVRGCGQGHGEHIYRESAAMVMTTAGQSE